MMNTARNPVDPLSDVRQKNSDAYERAMETCRADRAERVINWPVRDADEVENIFAKPGTEFDQTLVLKPEYRII